MPLNDADLTTATGTVPPGAAAVAIGPNANGGVNENLHDTIVLRGYLEQAGLVTAAPAGGAGGGVIVWRLFLSARRDVYVDFTAEDAIRVAPYTTNNPADGLAGADAVFGPPPPPPPVIGVVTLWLTTVPVLAPPAITPRHYFISRSLVTPTGFVSGALLDDLMDSQEARVQAWPEQDYGQGWPKSTRTVPCH